LDTKISGNGDAVLYRWIEQNSLGVRKNRGVGDEQYPPLIAASIKTTVRIRSPRLRRVEASWGQTAAPWAPQPVSHLIHKSATRRPPSIHAGALAEDRSEMRRCLCVLTDDFNRPVKHLRSKLDLTGDRGVSLSCLLVPRPIQKNWSRK
jgi:hypothetical protein